ncbi:glycoside hydrolase family 2 TIM barrel-domain containing protein [Paenibacillus sp. GD4]|uniref:glycoside hydrolase family 2 protein n=1 Tax=Paenibacillus sp. GD4 TaxID=3068890 RepID=UPI0027968CC3|nr:glycoside hydrolase family 2 TIM barrel-domain containing protein [Paenibacillus sp. GD4]MDQ1909822.1 glycoside hydrolase family 2 TIM barrel-domain containing protein [Paenibacillus sp. GD4]
MIRTFPEHVIRSTKELSGPWDFITDPNNIGIQDGWFRQFPSPQLRVTVPSCWNNEMGFFEYEGVAWYRTELELAEAGPLKLIFHAVLGHADVYLDGEHLGYHYGGYTPFHFIVENAAAGKHELIVRTDSTLTKQTIPIDPVDWFHYGGIIRPVELQMLEKVFIDKLRVDYTLEGSNAEVSFSLQLRSLDKEERKVPLSLTADREIIHQEEVLVPAGQTVAVSVKQQWSQVRLWNVGRSELYLIGAAIPGDDLYDRIGFRRIEVRDHQICINGEPVYLQGVNRHEEHPEWGFAFPPKLMRKDLDIILEMGCNSVRGSHYPQSKYWIDLLDEQGLVFWSEIPMWGALMPKEVTVDPLFQQRAHTMVDEMIERDFHHPCIVFWSVHNEIDTTCEEGLDISEKLVKLVRSKDSSRLVAYATMHPLKDIVMPLFDVIGINKYHGWYEGEVAGFRDMLEQFHARAEALGAGDRPVLMTEFGGAGIYGDTGWEPRLFSEDYQAHIVTEALRIFREDPRIVGTYVWQFADVRGDLKSYKSAFRDRARSFNNKGLVNEYRKPKQSFREVRAIYRSGEK